MKSIIIVCLSLAVVVLSECPDGQKYTDRYDNIDLNEILSNAHLLKGYVDCILDKGKCTPEGKELKSHIQGALENDCQCCTEKQVSGTRQVIGHFVNEEPKLWDEVVAKYDPKKIYSVKYETELRKLKA